MAVSLSEEKESETRPPTPDTLVEDPRNVDNVNDKALESAEGSIKEDKPLENVDDSVKEEEETVEDEVEYASGIKLGFIVIALALSIFLVCHPFLLRKTIVQSLIHSTGLIRYDHCCYDNPENHR
jgi:hypothetical protein